MTTMAVQNTNVFLSYNVAASSDLGGVIQLVTMFKPTFIFLQEVPLDSDSLVKVLGLHAYQGLAMLTNWGAPSQGLPP